MVLYPSAFTQREEGVPINGLVWMGSKEFMAEQIEAKLKAGFNCIKLKIGALKFEEEYQLLKALRNRFSEKDITIRVDANGILRLGRPIPLRAIGQIKNSLH